jgi:signal peptidase II
MKFFKNKYFLLFIVAGVVVALDQITKALVLAKMPLYHSIPVVPGCFNLTHVQNPGGAFGFMAQQSSPIHHAVFVALSIAALCLVFYFYVSTPEHYRFLSVGFALISGGAVGNLVDRIRFGRVIDFLDVYIGRLHWPAFNIADSAVFVGIGIFLYHLVFKKMPE